MNAQAPIIRIMEFFKLPHTISGGEDGGKTIYRDWVRFAPFHSPQSTVNEELVERLRPKDAYRNDDDGLKSVTMRARWSVIGPAYDAWLAGNEIPQNGTPLAAWPGASKEQVKGFRMHGIGTVEEVAALTDSQIVKIQLPNVRENREQARRFLDSTDANRAAEQLRMADEKIAALEDRLRDIEANVGKSAVVDEAPKRRGRPPKSASGDVMSVAEALAEGEQEEAA